MHPISQKKSFKIFTFLLIGLIVFFAQPMAGNCEELKLMYLNQECIAVVRELPDKQNVYFKLKNGFNPHTEKKCNCSDEGRLWSRYISDINLGDTIIKKRGELTFSIHKKDSIIKHYWECGSKIYYDKAE